MAEDSLTVTGGVIRTYKRTGTGTPHEEYVRQAPVTGPTLDEWPISTTVRATPVAADLSRVAVHFYNDSDANTVFIRLDGTNPTTASYMFPVLPRQHVDLGPQWARLNIRMIADGTGGTLHTSLGGADV